MFPPSSPKQHPATLGLPEEQRIRSIALQRHHLAVIAVSSMDATNYGRGCWSPEKDLDSTAAALMAVLSTKTESSSSGLHPDLPLFALGASSGGAFVLLLPSTGLKIDGIVAQIMGVPPHLLHHPSSSSSSTTTKAQTKRTQYPPTVMQHMPKDTRIGSLVQNDIEQLKNELEIDVAEIRVLERPVTSEFLSSHSGGALSSTDAEKIVELLKQHDFIDSETNMLREDPRRTYDAWSRVVAGVAGEAGVSLEPDASPLTQLLNVAWAQHEIVSWGVDSALAWLQLLRSGSRGDIGALLEQEKE